MQGRGVAGLRLSAGAVVLLAIGASTLPAAAVDANGMAVITCPDASFNAPGIREMDDYTPFRTTDGTVLVPKAFGEVTVVLRVDGEPTEVGTLSPSTLGATDHNPAAATVCTFTWSRDYVLDGRRHLDSYFGTVTVLISGRPA